MLNKIISQWKYIRTYIDQIVFIILLLIMFSFYVFYELGQIHEKEKDYIKISDAIQTLKLLNKDFDNFFLNQKIVVNYDKIEKKISTFSKKISYIQSRLHKSNLEEYIKKIDTEFEKKRDLIEKFKSYHSSSLYSLVHIIHLSDHIKKNLNENSVNIKQTSALLDNSLHDLIQVYLNLGVGQKEILEDMQIIKTKYKDIDNREIVRFLNMISDELNKLTYVDSLRSRSKNISLEKYISKLNSKFNEEHNNIVYYQDKILYIIFLASVFLIFLLFYTYIKTIHMKRELLSFKYAVENSDDSIVITDKNRLITYVNDSFVRISGYSKDSVIGKNPKILKSGKLPDLFYSNMNKILDQGEKWSGEFVNRKKNGEIYYEKSSITPIYTNNKLTGYLAIKLDVTEYIKQQKRVEYLAYHDSLTTLPNRLRLKNVLSDIQDNLPRYNHGISMLLMDIDEFKTLNDALGHEIGDMILEKIAILLKSYLKNENNIFRIGGDEFAVLLINGEDGIKLSKGILDIFKKLISIDNFQLKLGISIGIATYEKDMGDIFDLIKFADMALNRSKKNAKSTYTLFSKQLSDDIHKKWEIEQALSNAFINNEFYVVYQPKYDLIKHKLVSMEALIRWKNEKLGDISPAYFIPMAEDTNLIHEIGKFVFRKSCEDFVDFKKIYKNIESVSINVSAAQLINKNLLKEFQNIMQGYAITAHDIGLEVTETHIMHNIDENIISLQNMKNAGFTIILDDFGTGYASMNYLKKLPIEVIKIDKSFIDNICIDENDLNIVKATIAISKSLGYKTVAEGIETKEQEDILSKLGVLSGQGYLFAKPMRKEEVIDFLQKLS